MSFTTNEAKWLSIFTIGIGSFAVGIIPACIFTRGRAVQRKLFLSALLCFGGGVLFATSTLHMLPETREALPNYAELVFCCGFLLLYLVDEVAHFFFVREDDSASQDQSRHGHSHIQQARSSRQIAYDSNFPTRNPELEPNVQSSDTNLFGRQKVVHRYGAIIPSTTQTFSEDEESFLCHGAHTEPCANSSASHLGLALALTIHSLLEGLAVGLQQTTEEVLLLIGAVVSHKFVVAFCLGLELAESSNGLCSYLSAMLFFSCGSSLGIGLGMLASEINPAWENIIMPVLQGLAGGTLLYVTVSEVLPRERARWHKNLNRSAGIVQFFSVVSGFTLVYFLNKYLAESHHSKT